MVWVSLTKIGNTGRVEVRRKMVDVLTVSVTPSPSVKSSDTYLVPRTVSVTETVDILICV